MAFNDKNATFIITATLRLNLDAVLQFASLGGPISHTGQLTSGSGFPLAFKIIGYKHDEVVSLPFRLDCGVERASHLGIMIGRTINPSTWSSIQSLSVA